MKELCTLGGPPMQCRFLNKITMPAEAGNQYPQASLHENKGPGSRGLLQLRPAS